MITNEKGSKWGRSAVAAAVLLDDGSMAEMVYRTEDRATLFVTGLPGSGLTAELPYVDIKRRGRIYPYSPNNNLLSHGVVLLPSRAQESSAKDLLIRDVRTFIHTYADVSESFEEIASYYVLLSWIYDAFNEVPYLRLKGDFGSGKSRCLVTIGSLCYKPMFASGGSTVSPLFRIIDDFRGTLVIDEGDFRYSDARADIIKILNNGNAVGFPVLRSEPTATKEFSPRAFVVFGPKIIATRHGFEDRALESRCITEVMSGLPPRPDIPLSLPSSFQAEALELRNRLLSFRFRHLRGKYQLERWVEKDIEPRVMQVFAPLIAIVDRPVDRERIVERARQASRIIKAERSAGIEAQLLDIMWELRNDAESLSVKVIAERFAERYGGDYRRPITARWIGGQLRSRLSLTPVKTHGVFLIPSSDEERLESLFARFGFTASDTVGNAEGPVAIAT
jgi:hypothetical protein